MDPLTNDLIDAAKNGNLEKIIQLIDLKVPIDSRDKNGWTALLFAAMYGYLEIVRTLIRAGIRYQVDDPQFSLCLFLDFQDGNKIIALAKATFYGHSEVVRELINAGASLNMQNVWGRTAVVGATMNDDLEVVQELIKAGADINIQDENGWTALMFATVNNSSITIEKLLRAGANIDLRNKDGKTASDLSGNIETDHLFAIFRDFRSSIKKIEDLRFSKDNYFSVIPRDLIFLIKHELELMHLGKGN